MKRVEILAYENLFKIKAEGSIEGKFRVLEEISMFYSEFQKTWEICAYEGNRNIKEVEEESREDIKSPITGKVVSIKVQEGQRVKKGDALAVISAMKMEIILSSPDDAIVERVFKKEGELVNKDEIVIKLSFLEKG